jgi:hypothetical protein
MSGESSGAPNAAAHLEYTRIFIYIVFIFYHYGQFRSVSGEVQALQMRQFGCASWGSLGALTKVV